MSIAQSITITPNTNQLTFTAQAKMADEPDTSYRSDLNNTDTANRLYLSDESDRVNYRLTISNNSGSIVPAGNFMYYIPIPKSTIFDYHQFNGSPQFDLSLTGPVTITGNNPSVYDMRYSTDATGTNYNNGKADFNSTDGQATWLTAEQVNNNWSAVTMIKIIGAQTSGGYIPTGTVDNFTLSLSYSGVDTVLQNAGKSTSWGSCGIQKYKEDGTFNINGDHSPTKYVTVMLRSEVNREITLTAAEDMIPTSPAVKTDTIALPAYTLSETIKILSISTENVVLVPSIGITPTAADEASGATANGTFAITAKLADFTAYDLLAGVVSQELGSTTAGTPTNLTFTLYNYNALSDISTPRSVTVVLGDGEGVQITVKITIAREKASVTALTHIESGKSYQLMHGSSETVTITQDSAFTAQYVLNFIPDNYTGHTVSLHDSTGNNAVDFPVGTTLTLIDLKDTATPIYAYYKFTSAVSSVALSNFILMTNGTDSYHDRASDAGANPITEKLLLIVDFPDTENNIVAADTYKLKMTIESGSTPESIERTLILTDKRTFSLTSALTQNPTDNTLTAVAGTASTASGNPNDSRWLYRKMALVVTLSGNIGNTPFPEGAYIEMGGNRYVPSGNMIILPLGSLGEYDYTYTLATPHTRLDAGDYTLNTALYISATANDSSPMGGDKVDNKNTTFTVTAPSEYAIKLSISQDKHIFKKSELTANPNITLNIGYNAASASSAITLELQKKVGETYLTQTNLIEGASVGDDTFTVNGFGLIAISSRGSDAGYFDVTLTLKSSELTPGATYRILAKVSASGEKTQAVYNIVVVR